MVLFPIPLSPLTFFLFLTFKHVFFFSLSTLLSSPLPSFSLFLRGVLFCCSPTSDRQEDIDWEEMGLPDNETQKEKETGMENKGRGGQKKRIRGGGGPRVCFSLTRFANFGRASWLFLHWL